MSVQVVTATPEAMCKLWVTITIFKEAPAAFLKAWCNRAQTTEGMGWAGELTVDTYRINKAKKEGRATTPGAPKKWDSHELEIPGHTGHIWISLNDQDGDWLLKMAPSEPIPVGKYTAKVIEKQSTFPGKPPYHSGLLVPHVDMPRGPVPTADTMQLAQQVADGTGEPVLIDQQTLTPVGSQTALLREVAELKAQLAQQNRENVEAAKRKEVDELFGEAKRNDPPGHPDSTLPH